ncbi:MAG: hypothetical protein HY841_10090 [Bacteroidetes bacterium]|nr:hypothetical protein [Bacteroidota bacterium]
MKNFLAKLLVFSITIAIIDFCWIRFMPIEKHIPHVWMMFAFFIAVTIAFHFLSLNASKGKPQGFIRFYMGSTALRFFLYIMVILAYRFYDKPTLIPFAIGFMAHYFFFTVFEVPVLLKELKK